MRLAYFIKKDALRSDPRVGVMLGELAAAGAVSYPVTDASELQPDTDMLLSMGGDGTFLDAARMAVSADVPVVGVNFGRLGFLSENRPDDVVASLLSGDYVVERRTLLSCRIQGGDEPFPYALNELCVARTAVSMLGVDVVIDGVSLPTYWADGLLVATSSGSTAYSLSVGGPICTPDSRVLIVAPVAPHNLNVRPLIISETSSIRISMRSREDVVTLSTDTVSRTIPSGSVLEIKAAPVRLRRVRLSSSNFINALRSRLLWGEDVRNKSEQY